MKIDKKMVIGDEVNDGMAIGDEINDGVAIGDEINDGVAIGDRGKDFFKVRLDLGASNGTEGDVNNLSGLRNRTSSLSNIGEGPASNDEGFAERKPENSMAIATTHISSLVEGHTADSQMDTLSATNLGYQEEQFNIKVTQNSSKFGNPFKGNASDKRNITGTKQHVTPNLDHHGHVTSRSKAVSSCQSLVARVFSWRSMMLLMLHLSFVINTIPKNTAPMAIVCMVRPRSGEMSRGGSTNATRSGVTDGVLGSQLEVDSGDVVMNTTTEKIDDFEFDWDSNTVGLVLSAISFTSWVGPLFTDTLRGYLGNKWTLTLLTIGSAVATLLSPLAARIGPAVLVGLRVVSGVATEGNTPIVADTIVWWTPVSEKLTATTLTYCGYNMAGIVSFFIAGFLCSVPIDNGWPFVFYVFGAIILLWTLAWHIMTSQKPEDHPWISDEEKSFIIATRGFSVGAEKTGSRDQPPYRDIMTSVPVIALFFVTSVHVWSLTIIYTYIPVYFSRLLGFTYEETGVLVSCVSFCRLLGAILWTIVENKLMSRPGMTTNKSRKIIYTAGSAIAGVFFVAVTFVASDLRSLAATLMCVAMVSQSVSAVVMPALVLDMAPRYAGFISGMSMSIASVVAIPAPLIVAALTPTNSQSEWTTVWLIMSAATLVGAVIFLVFGQASLLPWADNTSIPTPHVITPFVQLGRRMTLFVEAPPLTLGGTGGDHTFAPAIIPHLSGFRSPAVFLGPTKRTRSDMELASESNGDFHVQGEDNPEFQPDGSFVTNGLPPSITNISVKFSDRELNGVDIDGKNLSQFENLPDSINGIHINDIQLKVAEETYDTRL
ncbi:unnamed protein product [Lymnaea stagnalis]|uniref:Major facilitator superfamily (MFS) profile domain-containing protein n=1 Tax=Lymnaea stagnalis TaxID=6523 RepID=A0AAV2HKZ9_LYMST